MLRSEAPDEGEEAGEHDDGAAAGRPALRLATSAICGDPDLADTRVLILITFETDEHVAQALRAGAVGFLGKDVQPPELLSALRRVAAGHPLLSAVATRAVIDGFLAQPEAAPDQAALPERPASPTAREREAMAMAAIGLSNEEIAARMHVNPFTVRTHVHRAMAKLDARDRAQLVAIAYRSGLVRAPHPPE
ncbi:LuxR C-terminal-related transcriptional regulator [Streptomyces sp. NPDC003863]